MLHDATLQNRPLARYRKTANANFDHMSASARQSFQVVFCTGSDAGFPVTEQNEHSPHTKGWQSPRFCECPQEIGIELHSRVLIQVEHAR